MDAEVRYSIGGHGLGIKSEGDDLLFLGVICNIIASNVAEDVFCYVKKAFGVTKFSSFLTSNDVTAANITINV